MRHSLSVQVVKVAIFLACLAAWLTHLYVCFVEGLYGFLIAGAIVVPIAVVHGMGIWLGIW